MSRVGQVNSGISSIVDSARKAAGGGVRGSNEQQSEASRSPSPETRPGNPDNRNSRVEDRFEGGFVSPERGTPDNRGSGALNGR